MKAAGRYLQSQQVLRSDRDVASQIGMDHSQTQAAHGLASVPRPGLARLIQGSSSHTSLLDLNQPRLHLLHWKRYFVITVRRHLV